MRFARGRRHVAGVMNKLEARYAQDLEARKRIGSLVDWRFEAVKLRLADKTFYMPDFLVIASDMTLEMHETKGFMRDDAAVKLKVAAEQFPYLKFLLVTAGKHGWETLEIGRTAQPMVNELEDETP